MTATTTTVEEKIKRINDELCRPWAEKITNALFKDADTQCMLKQMKERNAEGNNNNSNGSEMEKSKNGENANEQKQKQQQEEEEEEDLAELEELRQREELVFEERDIVVEFDWGSFSDLFTSLINEGAAEVIDTILDSLISKDCAISLLSSLLEHSKRPSNS